MTVSVIIPTLNEAGSIKHVLNDLPQNIIDEIIIVDGNSVDETREIVLKYDKVKLINQTGKGFGNAFRVGINEAKGDVLVLMDGDYSHNPADVNKLLAQIEKGYDLAMGSRYLPGAESQDDTLIRFIGNKVLTFTLNLLYHSKFSDVMYLFVAYKKSKLSNKLFKTNGFEFCIEFLLRAKQASLNIKEIPLVELKRIDGTSKVRALKDGIISLFEILKMRKFRRRIS